MWLGKTTIQIQQNNVTQLCRKDTEKRERAGLKCVGNMREVIEKMPKHIERLKGRYAANVKVEPPKTEPKKKAVVEPEKATHKRDQVVALIGRIREMLKEAETYLA